MTTPQGNLQPRNAESSSPVSPPATMSLKDAAAMLARRRNEVRQQGAPEAENNGPAPKAREVPEVEEETPEGLPETDETEQEPVAEGDEGEPAEELEASDDETTDDLEDAVFEIDGEQIPVKDVLEWRENGLRAEDYQRKTQVLAQQQQAVSAMGQDIDKFAHGLRRMFESQLSGLATQVRQFETVDWNALASNPQQYQTAKARYDVAKGNLQRAQEVFQQFLGEYDELSDRAVRMKAQAALPEIKAKIKGWNDALYAERSKFAIDEYGADPAVINKVTDSWFWVMLNDAYTYRQGAKLPTNAKKIVKKSPAKTPRPGAGRPPPARPEAAAEAIAAKATSASPREQVNLAVKLLQHRRAARNNQPPSRNKR